MCAFITDQGVTLSETESYCGKVENMHNGGDESLRKIWVGNMEIKTSEQKLRQYFSEWGNIEKVIKPLNHSYAFIIFSSKEAVQECIAAKPHKLGSRIVDVELGRARQGWAGKGNTGNTRFRQPVKDERANADFQRLKMKLEEKEKELKLELDKVVNMKRERDLKVDEVENMKKAIAGLKRNEEAAKEKKEMEQKILVFKKTLEKKTSASQGSAGSADGETTCKTEKEKLAMKQKKIIEISSSKDML